ncbi:MAG: glycosyltransferase [Allorhizobium sp.]
MIDFSFVVITFNHEEYILEHLESIAYQIRTFGQGRTFQLIVADDASQDLTIKLAEHWLENNKLLFADVQIHTQRANQGTCINYTKVWPQVKGGICKLTAGDDVYSCENLLEEWSRLEEYDMSSGYPLYLESGKLRWPKFYNLNIATTNRIYRRSEYMKRLIGVSFAHTPSIIFKTRILRDLEIRDFIRLFSVTEDYPMHVKMAERLPSLTFTQSPLIHIYYRRTAGSTYLVRSRAFEKDKIAIFVYLRDHAARGVERILMANRLFCFRQRLPLMRRLLNLNYIIYFARASLCILGILRDLKKIDPDVKRHQLHYEDIRCKAEMERAAYLLSVS